MILDQKMILDSTNRILNKKRLGRDSKSPLRRGINQHRESELIVGDVVVSPTVEPFPPKEN